MDNVPEAPPEEGEAGGAGAGAIDVVEPGVFWQLRFSVAADPELAQRIIDLRAGLSAAAAVAANDRAQAARASRLGATGGAKVEKDFIALMNKLSIQNHGAIEAQLWRFFQPLLFTFYTNHLWSLMYRQPSFNALYVGVLRQVHDRLGEEDRAKLKAVMRSHFEAVFRGFAASMPPMILPAGEDYDEFCDAVRLKKQSVGKVAALCASLKAGLLEDGGGTAFTAEEVLRRLTDEVPPAVEPEMVSIWTEHVQAALGVLDLSLTEPSSQRLRAAVDRLASATLPPKARFRIIDLAERLRGGADSAAQPQQPQQQTQAKPHHPHGRGGHGHGHGHGGPSQGGHGLRGTQPPPPAPVLDGDWREAKRKGGRR